MIYGVGGWGLYCHVTEVLGDSGGCDLAGENGTASTVMLFRHSLNPCVCFHWGCILAAWPWASYSTSLGLFPHFEKLNNNPLLHRSSRRQNPVTDVRSLAHSRCAIIGSSCFYCDVQVTVHFGILVQTSVFQFWILACWDEPPVLF